MSEQSNYPAVVEDEKGEVVKGDWYKGSYFEQSGFPRELVWTVKQTVFPKATTSELLLFLQKAQSAGLDPTSQLIPVKFTLKSGESRLAFITTRNGLQSIAERTKCYGGSEDFVYDNEQSLFEHVQEHGGTPPTTATARVRKYVAEAGEWVTVPRTVYWQQYYPKNPSNRGMWDQMPHVMLAKCAEAAALRAAFPLVLDGLYLREELGVDSDFAGMVEIPATESQPQSKSLNERLAEAQTEKEPEKPAPAKKKPPKQATRKRKTKKKEPAPAEEPEQNGEEQQEPSRITGQQLLSGLKKLGVEDRDVDKLCVNVFGGQTTFEQIRREQAKKDKLMDIIMAVGNAMPEQGDWSGFVDYLHENSILLRLNNVAEHVETYLSFDNENAEA